MPDRRVVLVNTSVLDRLIGLDGEAEAKSVLVELEERRKAGQLFVIPVTAIVETGNHVAQRRRRDLAERLVAVVTEAKQSQPPWIIRSVTWDESFLDALIGGDSTGFDLVTLLGNGMMGTGDVAILVERDNFRDKSAYTEFEVWSLDSQLRAHGQP